MPATPQIHITRVVVSQCPSVHSLSLSLPLFLSLSLSFSFCLSLSLPLSLSLSFSLYVRSFRCASIRLCIEIAREFAPCCRPTRSICKPPRNESVNPVTSFAAILALRRRRSSPFSDEFSGLVPSRMQIGVVARRCAIARMQIRARSAPRLPRNTLVILERLGLLRLRVQRCENNGNFKSTPCEAHRAALSV